MTKKRRLVSGRCNGRQMPTSELKKKLSGKHLKQNDKQI